MTFEEWLETEEVQNFQACMEGIRDALVEALKPVYEALVECCQQVAALVRSFAYGTLRRRGIPHWLACPIARRIPFRWALRLAIEDG